MNKKRTTDLFRFVTLRAPQLLTKERRQLGFVEPSDPSSSVFLSAFDASDEIDVARDKVNQVATSFSPFSSMEDIKGLSEELWEFSLWLGSNKNILVRSELDAKIPSSSFSSAEIMSLWDNVYYDFITEKNPYVRQACLQLLVAINFIAEYENYSPATSTDEEEIEKEAELLKRLANGKVIIDQAFSSLKVSGNSSGTLYQSYSARKQESQHRANIARLEVSVWQGFKKELCNLSKTYATDYNTAYEEATASYKTRVDKQVQAYLQEHPDIANSKNPEELIPDGVVDTLNFTFADPLSSEYTKGKLSQELIDFINDQCLRDQTIESVETIVCKEIDTRNKEASKVVQKRVSTVTINGVTIKPSSSVNRDFALSFEKNTSSRNGEQTVDVYLSMNTGYNGASFDAKKSSFSISGIEVSELVPSIVSTKNNTIFVKLNGESIPFPENQEFEFKATIKLNNGSKYSLEKKGSTNESIVSGLALYIVASGENTPIYGVNRIGVADYRKVEQELCCYIPGEVSHIENILAREYKERSTRNLTRTESSIETSTEREIEESNDTTSSSRHEMSSEISEVLEKDRSSNFGFDTGVSGKALKKVQFSANAFADFSFGQSSSNSNTIARNYAEDVTRRALERIVQKTSTKRTSTIIREFEDINKHGYDNREGDKHVTGVFRWIDKVYNNRVINYGKRLMYEFMIPEPARFYKEAIIIEAEEEGAVSSTGTSSETSVLIKPTHPSEHGISGADRITRDTYANFASLYGISVTPPEDAEANVHGSFSESIGSGDSPRSFSTYTPINVPVNYECYRIDGSVSFNFRARVGAKAYIKVATGGRNWQKIDLRGEANSVRPFSHSGLNIPTSVQVSVNTKKITAFTLSVDAKCKLKGSIFSQWQQDVYDDILQAYEQQLQAYNDAQAFNGASGNATEGGADDSTFSVNPKFNAQIIHTEIKRLCIEMLTKPFGRDQGKDFYEIGECEVPELKLGANLDAYSSQVKFFEQAFDWEILSQLFYPYYWAKKCDWKALFQSQVGNDHVFQAFLQSGMGRVIVPVKQGFEDAVALYMETGKIWNGTSIVMDTDDELYLSIVDEMTTIEGTQEGEVWQTIVPSNLTIVQAKSALLDDEGLPCCEDDEVIALLNIKGDDNILKGGDTNQEV